MRGLLGVLLLTAVAQAHMPTQEGFWIEEAEHDTKACARGKEEACDGLGVAYERGHGVAEDVARAHELYARACTANVALACSHLGVLEPDPATKQKLFEKSCKRGSLRGCANLGLMLNERDRPEWQRVHGRALLERACRGRDAEGCLDVGDVFQNGIGVPVDLQRARDAYDASCSRDGAEGCGKLAALDESGAFPGIPAETIVFNWSMSCSLGLLSSCTPLARHLFAGSGTPKDPDRARKLLETVCDEHEPSACAELAKHPH